ncbi:hypothetical protein BJ138DRAFT_1144125 [Hygrophoropsis aurantiaca]|uniref:Uncharacterized protein n=1 Tax=Hygrophoropsis aurantiaca TaxID=72124 RepID=A0ACB8AM94_9AGAM|nr:hypothetical protein BJ138DRAFT_1144125 [Hygrophoropsis aurantiaca]
MSSHSSSPVTSGAEEHFDKAKKHLWASDAPTGEPNRLYKHAEHARSDTNSPPPHRVECHSPRLSEPKTKSEAQECIMKSRRNKMHYTLPSLTREVSIADHDSQSILPSSWKSMAREPEQNSSASSPRLPPLAHCDHDAQQRPVSLSVFNSPTATYMWPGFKAASQMDHPPVIYVNYERVPTRSASNSLFSQSQEGSPIILPRPIPRYDRSVSTLLPRKRRSSSPDERTLPRESSSAHQIVEPLRSISPSRYHNTGLTGHRHISRRVHPVETQRQLLPPMKLQQQGVSDVPSFQSFSRPYNQRNHRSSPSTFHAHSESSPSISDASEPSSSVPHTIQTSPKGSPEYWEKYARPTTSPDGTSRKWLCTWVTMESDRQIRCSYMSKKQLVKRHVETTHLRYKPFVCEVCNKGFPQKTSLDTHMHGHTGDTPHICRFGCGKAFKDPARRHRHMVEEHNYIPKQSKKKHKSGKPPQDSDFESVCPWNA